MPASPWIVWTALVVLIACVTMAAKSSRYRVVAVNLAAVAVAVLLFLGYLWLDNRNVEHFDPADWSEPHAILGNLPRPNQRLRWTRRVGFTDVFDITVTTNAHGFRVTPAAPRATKSILFFGCSFTFGHGVEDHETFPYLVGESLGGAVATYNFAFNGWGPNEMLAALQSGLVATIVKERPELAVYLTITDHVRRVIGREEAPWMARAPRFVLENGVAVRRGTFEDDPGRRRHSASDKGYWTEYAQEDLDLYGAVVKAARDEVAERFPGTRFEVIVWDVLPNAMRAPVIDALRAKGIQPHTTDEFLEVDPLRPFQYSISPKEPHPGPEGLRRLARFIETTVLKKN